MEDEFHDLPIHLHLPQAEEDDREGEPEGLVADGAGDGGGDIGYGAGQLLGGVGGKPNYVVAAGAVEASG